MLLAFAPGTDLSALWKAYIHGHYRRHPKTGQQVWVDSYSDKRPEKHRAEFAHWQHRIEHVKDHLAQGHTREALHAFHDLGHDDSHKLARDLGLHDDGPDFADKKTLMGAIHGRLLAKKHELQAQVGRQVKADFEKRKAAGTVGKKVGKAPKELTPGKGQLHTDSQGNQFLILARPNTWNNQDAGVRYELHEKLTGADRKFHKKSVSTYALTAMRQAVTGRMQELGTQQAKVADADDSLLVTAKPGPQKVVPKKHHEKTLQEYTLERAKKNKLPADHAGNAAWARIEHREAIQRAIAVGTQIAPEVVADHPELAPKADVPAKAKDTVTMSKQAPDAAQSWDSPDGRRTVVGTARMPDGTERIKVRTGDRPQVDLFKPDELKFEMKRDAANLASRAQTKAQQSAEETAQARANDLQGFADQMTPTARSRAQDVLSRNLTNRGSLITRKALIEREVKAGAKVTMAANGKRRLQSPSGSYLDENQISKIAMDYAEHISRSKGGEDAKSPALAKNPAKLAKVDMDSKEKTPKSDLVTMPKKELIAEHEKLVAVLKSPDHGDDLKEAKEQEAELKGYKGEAGGDAKAAKPKATPPDAADLSPAEIADAELQYQEVKARYQGTPGWLKAPNGQPSKLNERQWVQVRTPAFKAWFGDWEASTAVLDAVNLQLQGWAGSATELSLMARDVYTHELQGDKIDNASLGADIVFSSEGKGEAFGARGKMRNPIRAELVRVLRDIVHGAAKVAESKPDARREADTAAFHTLVMPLLVNDQLFSVKVTVREARLVPEGGIPHKFYDVTALQIEESPGVHGFAGHRAPGRPAPSEASKVSVAALAKTFKIDVASSVSKVVDANGEPLIVYHGTGADISGFDDQGKSTQGEGLGTGLGHFFATSKNYASDYAKVAQGNVMPTWLAIKRPLVITDREGMSAAFRIASDAYCQQRYGKTLYELENSEDDADYRTAKAFYDRHLGATDEGYFGRKNRFVRQQLQAMGYDGIAFKNDRQLDADGGEVLVAFTAPHVKSAIGNAGTFRPDLAHLAKAWPRTPIFFRHGRSH